MIRLPISSTAAAIISPPPSIEPSGAKPSRRGPRSPALPLWRSRQCVQPAPRVWSCPWSIKLTVPLISYRRLTGSEFLSGSRNLAALVRQTLLFHVLFDGSQQRDGTCPIFRIADLKMRIEERHH